MKNVTFIPGETGCNQEIHHEECTCLNCANELPADQQDPFCCSTCHNEYVYSLSHCKNCDSELSVSNITGFCNDECEEDYIENLHLDNIIVNGE